jgi:hypothetical protein
MKAEGETSNPAFPGSTADSRFWFGLLLILGILAFFHPMIFSGFTLTQTDEGDSRLVNYFLEHQYKWVTGTPGYERFWDFRFFYPTPNVGAYSEIVLGGGPVYWLLRALGAPWDSAFQAWMIAMASLNFGAFYLFLRKGFAFSRFGSALGAFVFAFGNPRAAQLFHQQLLIHFYTPLALLGLVRAFQESARSGKASWGNLTLFFGCSVLQIYSSFYLGWFLGLGVLLLVTGAMIGQSTRELSFGFLRANARALALGCAVSLALMLPWVLHYGAAARSVKPRGFGDVMPMIPWVRSWFNAGPQNWLYGWTEVLGKFSQISLAHEHQLFFGGVTSLLVVLGLRQGLGAEAKRRIWISLVVVLSMGLIVVSTRYFHPRVTLWHISHAVIPGASAIRALSRVILLLAVPAGIGVAYFFDRRGVRWLTVALLWVVVAEQVQTSDTFDKARNRERIEQVAAQIGPQCGYFVHAPRTLRRDYGAKGPSDHELVYEVLYSQVDAIWAQLLTDRPTLNGYSGNTPPGWELEWNLIRTPEDEQRVRVAAERWVAAQGLDPAGLCWAH